MKTTFTFLALALLLAFSLHAQTQSNATVVVQTSSPIMTVSSNMYYDLYLNVFHNPASVLVFFWLCVVAWLFDDIPIFNSRFVVHYTVLVGMSTYWLFAFPQSVPANFPHPNAVFMVDGTLVAFVAALTHKQAIARLLNLFRSQNGNTNFFLKTKPREEDKQTKDTP